MVKKVLFSSFFCLINLAQAFVIKDIQIEGLKRFESGTVYANLPFQIGDEFDDELSTQAIKSLFSLGLFEDINIEAQDDILIINVEERPIITKFSFSGLKEFPTKTLTEALKEAGFGEGLAFDKNKLNLAKQILKQQYMNRSYYVTEIDAQIEILENNLVSIKFVINEGKSAKITQIKIVGNKVFSESTLKKQFKQDSGNIFSWYTKSNRYSKVKTNADLESLKSFYLSRGYLNFKVESTDVDISPDNQQVSLIINIYEGDNFMISEIKLQGNYLGREEEFKSLIKFKAGEIYNFEKIIETQKAFNENFSNFGYAQSRINIEPEISEENKSVELIIHANPSNRVYVRKILINGNNRTKDEVIRREFRQFESAWYNGEKIKLSRDRINRLGYFESVNLETKEVPERKDQVDLVLNVVERKTGNINVGVNYDTQDKISFIGGINENNIFGTGHHLGLSINTSSYNKSFSIKTIDPYFTKDGISNSIELYYLTTRPYSQYINNSLVKTEDTYKIVTKGASIGFGIPLNEFDKVYLDVGTERINIKEDKYLPKHYVTFIEQFGKTINSYPLSLGWGSDSRDNSISPVSGRYQRLSVEYSPFGDLNYVKSNYKFDQYFRVTTNSAIALKTDLGWGFGTNDKPFPLLKNFNVGGINSVRGFESATLGPKDYSYQDTEGNTHENSFSYLGGTKKTVFNLEFTGPVIGTGNDRSLRWVTFLDSGYVFGENEDIDFDKFRSSVGAGLTWISPIGPLSLFYAYPIRKFNEDKIEKLQFQLGASF